MTGQRLLTGWGRTAPTRATVIGGPRNGPDDGRIAAAVRAADTRGILGRGLGRSYGDAAQNAGGIVVDMTGRRQVCAFDAETGVLTAEAGLSLDELMRRFIPQGWFVPVTPGTRYVTLGGAIAADIHGKNHHVDGSFTRHVLAFDLLMADGTVKTVTRDGEQDLFVATAGGMGLTGIVLRATVQLRKVESSYVRVDTERATDFEDMLAKLEATDDRYTYSVSWIDLLAKGSKMGRGVLTRGWHAKRDELPVAKRSDPLAFGPRSLLTAPPIVPGGLLNKFTVAAFNEVWYRKAPVCRRDQIQSIPAFFHPLDGVDEWNRIYGPRGFLQYQFVMPFGQEETLRRVVEQVVRAGYASFLAVFKRFGAGDDGLLSFPAPGWTLALDLPVLAGVGGLFDRLDDLVVGAGGRMYLAKDSRMRPELMERMYPQLDRFRAIREKADPTGVFRSDMARRLGL